METQKLTEAQLRRYDLDVSCHLCQGPLVAGECPAYHWNDSIHFANREKLDAGLSPLPIEPVEMPARADWGPCWVCDAPTDPEGRCTYVNDFFHTEPFSGWMRRFHSQTQMENAPPTSFLIDGFLALDAITALAAPVGQRKSLAALNVAHALCTKEPLFDHFAVVKQPTRVLYLCPEMGLSSFTTRLRKIGLMPYVGKTLFCRTMSADGTLGLGDLTAEELYGAVVIIDTVVRYLEGNEDSSEDMRKFAASIFRLMREGASSVLLLHHSAKGTKESSELTLENCMRGSGELGAFVSSCWGTRLQNPEDPYKSASYFTNVKQRDFESSPFEVISGEDCRLHIVGTPGNAKLQRNASGPPRDADGKEEIALQFIRDNPDLSIREIASQLKDRGIHRSKSWVGDKRFEITGTGVTTK